MSLDSIRTLSNNLNKLPNNFSFLAIANESVLQSLPFVMPGIVFNEETDSPDFYLHPYDIQFNPNFEIRPDNMSGFFPVFVSEKDQIELDSDICLFKEPEGNDTIDEQFCHFNRFVIQSILVNEKLHGNSISTIKGAKSLFDIIFGYFADYLTVSFTNISDIEQANLLSDENFSATAITENDKIFAYSYYFNDPDVLSSIDSSSTNLNDFKISTNI